MLTLFLSFLLFVVLRITNKRQKITISYKQKKDENIDSMYRQQLPKPDGARVDAVI